MSPSYAYSWVDAESTIEKAFAILERDADGDIKLKDGVRDFLYSVLQFIAHDGCGKSVGTKQKIGVENIARWALPREGEPS